MIAEQKMTGESFLQELFCALLVIITVEFFRKWPEFWQALSLRACFENHCFFGSWNTNTPLFLTHYSQLHTNVCGKTIENLLLQVISIDLLFLSDIMLFLL